MDIRGGIIRRVYKALWRHSLEITTPIHSGLVQILIRLPIPGMAVCVFLPQSEVELLAQHLGQWLEVRREDAANAGQYGLEGG